MERDPPETVLRDPPELFELREVAVVRDPPEVLRTVPELERLPPELPETLPEPLVRRPPPLRTVEVLPFLGVGVLRPP